MANEADLAVLELERRHEIERLVLAEVERRYEIRPTESFYVPRRKVGREVASFLGIEYGPQIASLLIKVLRPTLVRPCELGGKSVFKGLKERT